MGRCRSGCAPILLAERIAASVLSSARLLCGRRVCPNALRIMGYVVQKLNAVRETRQWLAVRLSYGMNGILLPTAHLADLAAYMKCAPTTHAHC